MQQEPFDLAPDPRLGEALRDLLDGTAPEAFAAGVRAGLPPRGSFWSVLAGWAQPGIAAALLFATLAGLWFTLNTHPRPVATPLAEVGASDRPLGGEGLMGFALGGR